VDRGEQLVERGPRGLPVTCYTVEIRRLEWRPQIP
jgi:hypothetical protein